MFGGVGTPELLAIGLLAVVLFGNRLPSVARSMGRSLTEFKKGIQGLQDEVTSAAYTEPEDAIGYDEELSDRRDPETPAFQPPDASPTSREREAL